MEGSELCLQNFTIELYSSQVEFTPRLHATRFPQVSVCSPPVLPNSTSLILPFVYPDQNCICVSYFLEHATFYAPVSNRIHFRNMCLKIRI